MASRQKFATQVSPELLSQLRAIADAEGRQLQSVVEEAFADLVEKKSRQKPRPHVIAHYAASIAQFDELYRQLAK